MCHFSPVASRTERCPLLPVVNILELRIFPRRPDPESAYGDGLGERGDTLGRMSTSQALK